EKTGRAQTAPQKEPAGQTTQPGSPQSQLSVPLLNRPGAIHGDAGPAEVSIIPEQEALTPSDARDVLFEHEPIGESKGDLAIQSALAAMAVFYRQKRDDHGKKNRKKLSSP